MMENKAHLEKTLEDWKKEFPNLYSNLELDNFEPPLGWLGLIKSLSGILEIEGITNVEQVKQKFAGLRFYINHEENKGKYIAYGFSFYDVHEFINMFEVVSYSLCEICGAWGAKVDSEAGYLQSLCISCFNFGEKSKEKNL